MAVLATSKFKTAWLTVSVLATAAEPPAPALLDAAPAGRGLDCLRVTVFIGTVCGAVEL